MPTKLRPISSLRKKNPKMQQHIPFSEEDSNYENNSLPSLSGYLQQKSGFFGRWKKFWFVLSNGILYKFKSSKDTQPIEEYDISGSTTTSSHSPSTCSSQQVPQRILHNGKHVCGKENSIALFFQEGSETLILLANDVQDHLQWMDALNRSLPKHLRLTLSTAAIGDAASNSSGSNSSLNGSGHGPLFSGGGSFTLPPPPSSNHSSFGQPSRMESMLQVLEAVLDPTVISDSDGKIVGFNKAAEELFGWRKDEVLSKNVSILMPTMYAQHHDGYITRFKKWQDKRLIGKPRRLLAKHKQGHNTPIEISLGEIPHEEVPNDNMAFVAVFRPSIEDHTHLNNNNNNINNNSPFDSMSDFPNYPYSSSANSSLESSPLSTDSKDDPFCSGASSSFGNKKADSATTTTTSSVSSSAFSLDQDIERALHCNREKLDQRLSAFVTSMKSSIDSEYSILEKKFLLLQHQVNIVEQENERLFQQTEKQHEHIKLLEEELGVLQKTSDKFSLVQLLKNESTFKVFLEYCHKNNTSDLVMFYKEADDFRNKYSQIEGVVGSMEDEAKRIYENYLSDHSVKNINLPFDSKSNVKYHLSTPTCDMFDLAINDTLAILKEVSFDKFCESGSGKATLQLLLL
ncbi:hypothetical protein FDP41_003708 [Naegleria fowleri]|uniref:PH domain-containing protein n=1 Tax=Naegleria fowleri TaxID=5763 RepID=A0A6A5BUP8_NAEFO|nr:uncharacterized protein FDP41_003708 [Naegleria fowleri]KAF0977055.1 hypothetical protein FDP41_003708 [Naegleria fowleri]